MKRIGFLATLILSFVWVHVAMAGSIPIAKDRGLEKPLILYPRESDADAQTFSDQEIEEMILDKTVLQHVLVTEQATPAVSTGTWKHRVYYYQKDGVLSGYANREASKSKITGFWGVHENQFLCTQASTTHTYGPPRVSLNCYALEEFKSQVRDTREGDFLKMNRHGNDKGRGKRKRAYHLPSEPLFKNLDEVKEDFDAHYK